MTDIEITRLGHLGDGIAIDGSFHPFALPGEKLAAAPPHGLLSASPDRVVPPCPQFTRCGGCALQHASDGFVAGWKQTVVTRALAAQGLNAEFRPVATSPLYSRRRATLAGRRTKKGTEIGFHARRSDAIVPIDGCVILVPQILELTGKLGALIRIGTSRKGVLRLSVTETDGGADLAVENGKPLDRPLREALADEARSLGLARLTWNGEGVALASQPRATLGTAQVPLPPGAFLQASAAGQQALVKAVGEAVGDHARIVDLFAGCGTFSLPLAQTADVHAVEGAAEMLAALDSGWRHATGLRQVTTETRDLFRRPLIAGELGRFDAAVIDPPRAGAEAQVAEIAASDLKTVAMVSCNPVTFARDAATLSAAGFALQWVQVVDQFRFSPHIELAAAFRR
ncbi:class I SAM-dependent RNA methyltransferase [Algicella marina]|uniref:Class I SAM-dependent RNA methyltransferase n=1 Tax=Algicella marina TaxID=2683284 RepID=A0A6P1T5J2_9RHOB|nr:class I SAM-dependent RNA methyltransferase [Algicella marina]QHQ36980.1 class I SAM-dependent RNA methyltransferase [Algicella marina]